MNEFIMSGPFAEAYCKMHVSERLGVPEKDFYLSYIFMFAVASRSTREYKTRNLATSLNC